MADSEEKGRKAKFNQQNLHQEEVFTDLSDREDKRRCI